MSNEPGGADVATTMRPLAALLHHPSCALKHLESLGYSFYLRGDNRTDNDNDSNSISTRSALEQMCEGMMACQTLYHFALQKDCSFDRKSAKLFEHGASF
jgi:hypothetical protein